jgi:hypothetical protein
MMNLVTRYSAITILMGLVIFDSVASFVFWNYCGMIENNPFMLWALEQGWIYWLISLIKIGLVILLGYGYYGIKNRMARFAVWLLIAVFTFVWVQYFVGELM